MTISSTVMAEAQIAPSRLTCASLAIERRGAIVVSVSLLLASTTSTTSPIRSATHVMPPETLAQISVRMPPFSQFDFERAASPMREGGGGSGSTPSPAPTVENTQPVVVDALIAAGLLGSGPSNLDKLAAWADKHGALFGIDRCTVGGESLYLAWVEDSACQRDGETATDPQAAAGAVLARLQEQTDG